MRRNSVKARDPYDKPERYLNGGREYSHQSQHHNHHPNNPPARNPDLPARMPTAWMSQAQRTRYIKTGAIIFFVIFLFLYFSPPGVDIYGGSPVSPAQVSPEAATFPPASRPFSQNNGQVPSDSSYGTDRCTRSSSKDKPIVQYVLMIDAGSTGSRIHVYKFNNCGPSPELESEIFKQTKKIEGQSSGLSAYKDDPDAAAHSLDPLMQEAMGAVPDALKACTPVAVKATAGLRLIGPEKSQRILDAVRKHLENDFPFPVVSEKDNGVAILDGSDEGVYAWITVNYLLGKIGGPDSSADSAAVFDLGGGSTQIVFEPNFDGIPDRLAEGDHKYDLDFGGRHFTLYQHSHLGFGLMSARDAILAALLDDVLAVHAKDHAPSSRWMEKPVVNPCFSAGMSKLTKVTLPEGHALGVPSVELNMTGPSLASLRVAAPGTAAAQCRALAERVLKKDARCALAPCSFNGVHQPAIGRTFARNDVFLLSYFYDRTQPLGMPESFTLRELHDLAGSVCAGEASGGWDVFSSVPGATEELQGRPEHCLDLSFMVALTHSGYEMPIDREVKIAKKIKDNELGWCLGASLPLLSQGSGWKCKISEVH